MITKNTILDKEIFLCESHHFALLPWAEYKRKMPKESIYLMTFDYHADIIDPFLRYCDGNTNKMKSLLEKVNYESVDSIKNAIKKLKNDEHIRTAVGAGIIDKVYIVSYQGSEIPCSYEEEERLKNPYAPKYLKKMISKENVITPQQDRTYPKAKIHCTEFMPWGINEMGDEYDSDVLEDSFLTEKFQIFSRMSPDIILSDGTIKGKYILDIDLDYFRKLSALKPKHYQIFSNLVKNSEIITIAEETVCVELVRTDKSVNSAILKEKLLNLLTGILET